MATQLTITLESLVYDQPCAAHQCALRSRSGYFVRPRPPARSYGPPLCSRTSVRAGCFVQPPSANALASVRPGRTIVLSRRAMRDLAREHPTIRSQLARPQSRPEGGRSTPDYVRVCAAHLCARAYSTHSGCVSTRWLATVGSEPPSQGACTLTNVCKHKSGLQPASPGPKADPRLAGCLCAGRARRTTCKEAQRAGAAHQPPH